MKPIIRLPVLTLVASLLIGLGMSPNSAFAEKLINFLPLGDSITSQGYYIAPLTTLLTSNGYTPTMIANEGHSGFSISQLDSGIGGYLNHPNVNASNTYILLMIGINDVALSGYGGHGPEQLETLISHITEIAPLAHLIVAQLTPPNGYSSGTAEARVSQFNQLIVPVVEGFGPNASLVDMHTPFHSEMYGPFTSVSSPYFGTYANVHPNQAGGNLMAPVWYQGIVSVPEPGTSALAAIGMAGLLTWTWRKRRL